MKPLVLHGDAHWSSPYFFSVVVALEEKKVPYEVRTLDLLRNQTKDAAYQARSITGRIPALSHGDFTLTESSAIVEYLEEAFPAPAHARLYPESIEQRARARQLMSWVRSDETLPIRRERPTSTMFYERSKVPLSAEAEAASAKLIDVATRFLDGKAQPFATPTVADADLAFMLHRLILNGHPVPAPVRAYAEAQFQRPSVRRFLDVARPPYVPTP
jgi:glutathione S-transferase